MFLPVLLILLIPLISFLFGTIIPVTIPEGVGTALTSMFSFLNSLSFLIPVSTIGILLIATMYFQLTILLFRLIIWIIGLVRGNES